MYIVIMWRNKWGMLAANVAELWSQKKNKDLLLVDPDNIYRMIAAGKVIEK